MGVIERQELIQEIEEIRGRDLLTYVVSTRPNVPTQMDLTDIRFIREALGGPTDSTDGLDLFIYSYGGATQVSWVLANVLNEYSDGYATLIPYSSLSCATAVSLGAEEIVMGRMGALGPVDPLVANEFNPKENGAPLPISVEDVSSFKSMIGEMFEITDEHNVTESASALIDEVHPLALGNAYRHWLKTRDDTRKLLELHMDPATDKDAIDKIVEMMVEQLYFHGHRINRGEAAAIGLPVERAEDINEDLERLIWNLYKDYEEEMDLLKPYRDTIPGGTKRELPMKFVETSGESYTLTGVQEWHQLSNHVLQPDGQLIKVVQNQFVPTQCEGTPVVIGQEVWEKVEYTEWGSTTGLLDGEAKEEQRAGDVDR